MALFDVARSRDGERTVADETFGARLKRLREGIALTQEQLAEKAGLSQQTVSNLEQDQYSPTWPTVQLLCKALGVGSTVFEGTVEPTDEHKEQPRKRGRPRKAPPAAEQPPPPEPPAGGGRAKPKGRGKGE
jgi:transcriptional regulator with XRE-family HTH domain